jgi:hypothetical protein
MVRPFLASAGLPEEMEQLPEPITESDIADLVGRVEQSADALMAGDIDRYLALIHHAEDYTC